MAAPDLTRLTASVAAKKTVTDSAVTLLAQLSSLLRASAGDPAAITALADALDAQSAGLAAAITENTPAA